MDEYLGRAVSDIEGWSLPAPADSARGRIIEREWESDDEA